MRVLQCQQHLLFCTKRFPPGALGGPRPLCDTLSSAHGSTHEFSCDKSLCTLDKTSEQRGCSTAFYTHVLSGREPLKHAEKRTCCGTHCTRESCSTLLQPSSPLQLCHPVPTRIFTTCAHRTLVPHHVNPKGSFQIRRWCAREQCHGFPRKAQVLLHSQKPLRRSKCFTALNRQHRQQSRWWCPDDASRVPQSPSHHDAVIRRYFQRSTNVKVAQRVLVSLIPWSASKSAQCAVALRSNNLKGVE